MDVASLQTIKTIMDLTDVGCFRKIAQTLTVEKRAICAPLRVKCVRKCRKTNIQVMPGKTKATKNYQKDILVGIVDDVLPTNSDMWRRVYKKYQELPEHKWCGAEF